MQPDDVSVDPATLAAVASTIGDLADELHQGGFDEFLLGWSDAPASHPEAAAAIRGFGAFVAGEQRDLVAVLLALASRVGAAGADYQETDQASAALLSAVTFESRPRP